MSNKITFESAHAVALELKPAVGGPAVYLKFIAKMSRGAAKAMDAEYAVFGTDSLPKPGWTKMDSDFQARNVGLMFDVKSIGKGPAAFHLDLNCPLVDKFVFVRIGGKKKGKGAYVACKARALVDGRFQDVLEFLLKAGAADGVLTLKPREEQQPLQTILEHADGTAKSNSELFVVPPAETAVLSVDHTEPQDEAQPQCVLEPESEAVRVVYDEELKNKAGRYARARVVLMDGGYLAAWRLQLGEPRGSLLSLTNEQNGFQDEQAAIRCALESIAADARLNLRTAEGERAEKMKTPVARVVQWCNERLADLPKEATA